MNRESYYETAEMTGRIGSEGYASRPLGRYAPMGASEAAPMSACEPQIGAMPSYYSSPGTRFTFEDLKRVLDDNH